MKCYDMVNGKTNVYGIIGNPIEHTFSPILQNTTAQVLGYNMIYVPFLVENENVQKALDGAHALGIKGLNVTVPHKKAVMEHLYYIDKKASVIGAVNTLKYTKKGYEGYNTDIIGLEKCFKYRNIEIKDSTVIILGAGGAANAAAVLCASEGAKKTYIVNRTIENAKKLVKHIQKNYDVDMEALGYDELMSIENPNIIIQTTSLGMGETAGISPIKNTDIFKNVKVALDIIYSPWETEFLKDAKSYDCITINGFDMLIYQGIASYEIWNDINIDSNLAEKIKESLIEYYIESRKDL